MPVPVYATLDQYKAFINLVYERLYTDNSLAEPAVNDDWFEEDVEVSEAFVNKYVECRYNLELLTDAAKLFLRKIVRAVLLKEAYGREDFASIPESVEEMYKHAVAQLLDIRDGEFCNSWTTEDPEADPDEEEFPYVGGCTPVIECEENEEFI